MPPFKRAQFFHMHLLKCAKCRQDWNDLKTNLPSSRHNKLVEDVIRFNHRGVTI